MTAQHRAAMAPTPPAAEALPAAVATLPHLPPVWDPLTYTQLHDQLPAAARRRFNRLFTCAFHEQIAYLEETLTGQLIAPLSRHPAMAAWRDELLAFGEQELGHARAFRQWNETQEPALYQAHGWPCFVRPSLVQRRALAAMARQPWHWPWLIWFIMMQEERAVFLARHLLANPAGLDPAMVALHRWHLRDETDHLDLMARLLGPLWDPAPAWRRRLNAGLMLHLVREYFTAPKRAGRRVIAAWEASCPSAGGHGPALRQACRQLASQPRFLNQQYGPHQIPRTLALMARWPEFDGFQRWVAQNHREAGHD